LLLEAGRVVSRDRLVDALWGESPPKSATTSLQVYVHGLRQALGADRIETHGVGYSMRTEPGELDLEQFERLVERGRRALEEDRPADSAEDLRRALDLWHGPALADLDGEPIAEAQTGRLEDLRLRAVELHNDSELVLGRHDALLAELESLVAEHPYRERLREQHILALYRAGRQKEALDAYREARGALLDELGVEPGPALRELERAILQHDSSLAAPESQPRVEWHVPTPPTPLVGRHLEVAAVAGLLRRYDVRLVTLTGPGGTGKTRLSLAVAEELAPELRDGAAFVDLAAVQDASLLGSTIARVLGLQEGEEPLSEAVAERLRARSVLLVLDNLEQLLPAATFVADLLAAAPRLLVLATSRAPLRLSAEHVYPVPPLPTPATDIFEELAANDAVRLFVARARAADPAFELTDESARDVAEICRRLDGLPLAIELAAARTSLLSTDAIASRLEQSLELLTGGARDLPVRQQTLRATLDWSHGLLSGSEQALFARLAVFSGGWTIDAVEAVCADDSDVLASTGSLLDESLLRRDEDGRLGMLETIREYALERLELSGEADELRRGHAAYFVQVAEAGDSELTRSDELRVHERLESDHDNFRAALAWSQSAGAADVEVALVAALARFWLIRGHLAEGRRWLEDALSRYPGQQPETRAKALRGLAVLAIKHRDYPNARSFLDESIALSRELGDTASRIRSMLSLGVVAVDTHDLEEAKRLNEETLELARETGDRRVVATAINNLSDLALVEGDYESAMHLAEESLAEARELGHRESAVLALLNLSQANLFLQRPDEAARALEEALGLAVELGYRESIAYALEGCAAIAVERDDPVCAARVIGAAEALLDAIGSSLDQAATERHELTLHALREHLGDQLLAELRQQGRVLTVDEARAEATAVL
jgi:predicted ATPase/DNA-binding SARP family transcriptional activator